MMKIEKVLNDETSNHDENSAAQSNSQLFKSSKFINAQPGQ